MSVVQADPIVNPSLTQILRQLCRALNPVKALRKHRASPPASTDGKNGSRCRRGLQNSIEILNVVFSAAGTIPVVGQPLKDALEALYKILRQVEEKFQNAEAASKLLQRLASLGRKLSAVEDPDPLLAELTERLYSIRDGLDSLMCRGGVQYAAIAKALADFTSDIDSCLIDYIAIVQIQLQTKTRLTDAERLALQCVQVFDPFGHQQLIPRVDIQNATMVAAVILGRYKRNARWHQALSEFVTGGLYELTMDDGNQIQSLTAGLAVPLSGRGTVVMNVVFLQITKDQQELLCPTCQEPMPVSEGDNREVCTTCDRRVSAIKSKYPPADAGKKEDQTESMPENLFRNILIKHTTTTSPLEEIPEVDKNADNGRAEQTDDSGSVAESTPSETPKPAGNLHCVSCNSSMLVSEGEDDRAVCTRCDRRESGFRSDYALNLDRDYIQMAHNHIREYQFEEVSRTGRPWGPRIEYRLLVKGIEQARGIGGRVNDAKRVCAYKYLRSIKFVSPDPGMEARI